MTYYITQRFAESHVNMSFIETIYLALISFTVILHLSLLQ